MPIYPVIDNWMLSPADALNVYLWISPAVEIIPETKPPLVNAYEQGEKQNSNGSTSIMRKGLHISNFPIGYGLNCSRSIESTHAAGHNRTSIRNIKDNTQDRRDSHWLLSSSVCFSI